jgi:hypothetical protein
MTNKHKKQCMHCYEAKPVGIYEYISAGHTVSLGHCSQHQWQVERKAEQWRLDAAEPKTKLTHRSVTESKPVIR